MVDFPPLSETTFSALPVGQKRFGILSGANHQLNPAISLKLFVVTKYGQSAIFECGYWFHLELGLNGRPPLFILVRFGASNHGNQPMLSALIADRPTTSFGASNYGKEWKFVY